VDKVHFIKSYTIIGGLVNAAVTVLSTFKIGNFHKITESQTG